VQGEPARVASHDFEHKDAPVTFGRGSKIGHRFGNPRHRSIEAESDIGRIEIVVDRLGHADDRNPGTRQLQCGAERTIATQHDQRPDPVLLECLAGGSDQRFRQNGLSGRTTPRLETSFVRCPENASSCGLDPEGVGRGEQARAGRMKQALVAFGEADHLEVPRIGRANETADHGIEPGAIAAGGQDAQTRGGHGSEGAALTDRSALCGPAFMQAPAALGSVPAPRKNGLLIRAARR